MDIVRADAEGLLWLVVGVFWIIAQIAGAAAQKKRRPQSADRDEENAPSEDPMAELLRRLSGGRQFEVPEPEVHELSEELPPQVHSRPRAQSAAAWKPGEVDKLPDIQPLRQQAAMPPPIREPIEISDMEVRPKMSAFRSSLPTMRMPSLNMRINSPSYAESSRGKQGLGDELHLRNRKALRRAMLSHIILGKPKAFENGDNGSALSPSA